jgi:hypothetical protein
VTQHSRRFLPESAAIPREPVKIASCYRSASTANYVIGNASREAGVTVTQIVSSTPLASPQNGPTALTLEYIAGVTNGTSALLAQDDGSACAHRYAASKSAVYQTVAGCGTRGDRSDSPRGSAAGASTEPQALRPEPFLRRATDRPNRVSGGIASLPVEASGEVAILFVRGA